jgi:hypothetical protein
MDGEYPSSGIKLSYKNPHVSTFQRFPLYKRHLLQDRQRRVRNRGLNEANSRPKPDLHLVFRYRKSIGKSTLEQATKVQRVSRGIALLLL